MNTDRAELRIADIMIVDDTPANLQLLSKMLAQHGYRVRPVPDGDLALRATREEPPDLILLDIRMPEMDGYQVCEHLKADKLTSDIPVIFISALDATEDKIKAFHVGGVDYITKPFQVEEVLARVETHLSLRRLQRQLQEANRKMENELALAGEVQASFLPAEHPKIPGWQVSAILKPARETSGDFYDFIPLPDSHLGIVLADVTDKGAGASLYMALSCTLLRTYATEFPAQPELVFNAVNARLLKDTSANHFVTTFYGILDTKTGVLIYSNAGHCPPYVLNSKKSDKVQELLGTGIPLGIFEGVKWRQETVQFDPGDTMVLYTDGITEAHKEQPAFYGEQRLIDSVKSNLNSPAEEIQNAILEDVHRFIGDAPWSDDIALVVLIRE